MVNSQVDEYLANEIRQKASLYTSLECLNTGNYRPGKKHWLIQHACEVRDASSPTLEDVRRPLLEGVLYTVHEMVQGSVEPPILCN